MAVAGRLPTREAAQDDAFHRQARVSVVICAYTLDRWDLLQAGIASLQQQSLPPEEVIVVVDHNDDLFERASSLAKQRLPVPIKVVKSDGPKGISGARNTGWQKSSGEIVASLDDDAEADPGWLAGLAGAYQRPQVYGVGGRIEPNWGIGKAPRWFPEEFLWVVGCTFRGFAPESKPLRNLIGANMSFRRQLLESLGGFSTEVGEVGTSMLKCEDTEFCIRASSHRNSHPANALSQLDGLPPRASGPAANQSTLVYAPDALVRHHVPATRSTWRYFKTRCYTEGLAKAGIARKVGKRRALSAESDYSLRILPTGVARGLWQACRGDVGGLLRAAAIIVGFVLTTLGYANGRWQAWWQHRSPVRLLRLKRRRRAAVHLAGGDGG